MSKHLDLYKKDLVKSSTQYIILSKDLKAIESCDNIVNFKSNKPISDTYPFFITLEELVKIEEDKNYMFSCIHFNLDASPIICDVILRTYKDKNPLLILKDFTEHYNTYQITSQQRNESVITQEKIAIQNAFLKEQEAFKTEFIANFSHELREPLLGIIAFSDILKKTDLDYQQNSYLDIINNSGAHLKKLIEDILDISTLRSKKLKLDNNAFSIKTLTEDLTQIYTQKALDKGLEFKTVYEGQIPEIIISDQVRLRQILTNLLNNAITYTEKGDIEFKVSFNQIRAGKLNTTFSVTDTGIGIPKQELDNIFNSFAQLKENTITNDSKNFGLGLAITKELISAFDGKIDVESKSGKGTTFKVNINFKIDPTGKAIIKKEKATVLKETNKVKKVILLDNSEMVQMTLFKMMFKLKNYDLDVETNPDEFVDRLEINDYDLILLDMDLGPYNGLDILKKVRKSRDRDVKKLPIIAVTAKVLPKDLKSYKTAKINTILKKPFSEEELIQALNNEA